MRGGLSVILTIAIGLVACVRRDTPYRFQAPVVSAVRAPTLPARPPAPQAPAVQQPAPRGGADSGAARPVAVRSRDRARRSLPGVGTAAASMPETTRPTPGRSPATAPTLSTAAGTVSGAGGQPEIQPPAPAPAAKAPGSPGPWQPRARYAATGTSGVVDELRSRVGNRVGNLTSTQFAVATLLAVGAQVQADDRLRRITSGAELLALATDRDAVSVDERPLTADLVLLEPRGDADWLVGVVVRVEPAPARHSVGARTVEFVYLAPAPSGEVRTGFITAGQKSVYTHPPPHGQGAHERERARCSDARGQSAACLAGHRLHGYLRLDRLTH